MNWICMINGVGNASGRAEGIKEGIEQGLTQGRQEGIEIGEERGIAKGREEGLLTVIYTAFEQGLSTEVIASLTHMSIEEIERLREPSRS